MSSEESISGGIYVSQKFHQQIIGDNNLIMGSCHIAHDCKVGDSNIIANSTLLAGHVIVEVRCSFFSYIYLLSMAYFEMLLSSLWIKKVVKPIHLQDYTHTAGATVIHQFCHIGSFSFIGGGSVVRIFLTS